MGLDLEDPDTTGPMYQVLTEGVAADPISACHALRESIEGDWPTHSFTVVANERAKYLQWSARMGALTGTPGSLGEYATA